MGKGGEEGRDNIYIFGWRRGKERGGGHWVYNIVAPISRMMCEQTTKDWLGRCSWMGFQTRHDCERDADGKQLGLV